jgi:hypothetical protein
MWDLHPRSLHPVNLESPYFTINILKGGDGPWYMLIPRFPLSEDMATRRNWTLAVNSASTVLLIMRAEWGPSIDAIARNLCDRGIAFSTCRKLKIQRNAEMAPPPAPVYMPAATRPLGLAITREDYLHYRSTRRRLMLDTNLGRKCYLAGGLLARMARKDGVDTSVVLRGPSPLVHVNMVLQSGLYFRDVAYVDDIFSQSEIDALSGAINQWIDPEFVTDRNGRLTENTQKRPPSKQLFWPIEKADTWAKSGVNFHEWVERNEEWYRDCRDDLEESKFTKVATYRKRKAELSGDGAWRRISRFYKQSAAAVLQKMFDGAV